MGFMPDLSRREFGDFTVADKAIEGNADKYGIAYDSPQVLAAKKTIRLVHEFHKGFKIVADGGDPEEGWRLLTAAGEKMRELRPDINEVDRLVIAGLVSGLAMNISPEQLSKGQGYDFI
jgi:hypothetical protein